MPLRDDLLRPVSEDVPAGVDLSYDKVFDLIKEARTEEDDSIPAGTWSRAPKKADRSTVLRLAGEALATQSKDVRLAGWYGESLLQREGFGQLSPLLDLMLSLQQDFWNGLFPLQDDDGDLGRRAGALEAAAGQFATQLRALPVTRGGITFLQARDARMLAYEANATTQEKKDLREDAIQRGRVLPEQLDQSLADTPKAFYVETQATLVRAIQSLEALEAFHDERYATDPPSFVRLKGAIEDVTQFVSGALQEKRKLEPDEPEPDSAEGDAAPSLFAKFDVQPEEELLPEAVPVERGVEPRTVLPWQPVLNGAAEKPLESSVASVSGSPRSRQEALSHVAVAVRFLNREDPGQETAYALAVAPSLALLFRAKADYAWLPPLSGVRQTLRRLAREEQWTALLQVALDAMAANPETIWLDLQRYIWQAAVGLEQHALAAAVTSTVREYLHQQPDLDKALMDDDTPMASMETQSWLRSLRAELVCETGPSTTEISSQLAVRCATAGSGARERSHKDTSVLERALALLRKRQPVEAIGLLQREADGEPSGRLRFERRLEMAEVCLEAGHAAVAQPLLTDLVAEVEKRTLDGWESSSLLGKPLALLIRCLDSGVSGSDSRDTLFTKLCRLDPVAAASLDRHAAGKAG